MTATLARLRTFPDRLSCDRKSVFFNESVLQHGLGIRINGIEQSGTVVEYCKSKRWARIYVRNADGSLQRNITNTGFRVKHLCDCEIELFWKGQQTL